MFTALSTVRVFGAVLLAALFALGAGPSAGPAASAQQAGEAGRFSAEITYTVVGREPPRYVWAGQGQASRMGSVTSEVRDFSTGPRHSGTGVISGGARDGLCFSYSVDETGPGVWDGTFTIEGGSGRFEGAGGGGALTLILVEQGVVSASFDGTASW